MSKFRTQLFLCINSKNLLPVLLYLVHRKLSSKKYLRKCFKYYQLCRQCRNKCKKCKTKIKPQRNELYNQNKKRRTLKCQTKLHWMRQCLNPSQIPVLGYRLIFKLISKLINKSSLPVKQPSLIKKNKNRFRKRLELVRKT